MNSEHLLTVKDVAARLGAHPATIREWLRLGRLKGLRLGGTKFGWRIPESEVQRLLTGVDSRVDAKEE